MIDFTISSEIENVQIKHRIGRRRITKECDLLILSIFCCCRRLAKSNLGHRRRAIADQVNNS